MLFDNVIDILMLIIIDWLLIDSYMIIVWKNSIQTVVEEGVQHLSQILAYDLKYLAEMWCEELICIINRMNNKKRHTVGRVPIEILSKLFVS